MTAVCVILTERDANCEWRVASRGCSGDDPAYSLVAIRHALFASARKRTRLPCGLFLAARFRARRKAEIEIAGLERILVLVQRRIVGRRRHRKTGRKASVEQARAFQLVEPRQVGQRLEPEM